MRLYLAGPEVFLPDAESIGAAKKRICAAHGCVGVFPTDPLPDQPAGAGGDEWFGLYRACEAHLRGCDALLANLTPFRGPSADVGTVFEMGLMRGLGRPVFGYANVDRCFRDRTLEAIGTPPRPRPGGGCEDAEGMLIEDFQLFDNLMLEGGIRASGGLLVLQAVPAPARWRDLAAFERCVEAAARSPRRAQLASASSA
ncbi:nucleoside 2-deoxyribosyltransferase [Roseomonas sp. NAR14]|uniref:Nucleoside 2-deoxyribosyltransferase n=1 Tax=Roseomonas acroporae TaxID=2937791 RepID=A0A9X2BSX6_9PROT|nr:nucleoside 2-deoxyribosyltransferase [Roseomonas acroporae]MCK8783642.1 nucleoside 2-deoxyribosyltransferase [Roseomonas acroporae]